MKKTSAKLPTDAQMKKIVTWVIFGIISLFLFVIWLISKYTPVLDWFNVIY